MKKTLLFLISTPLFMASTIVDAQINLTSSNINFVGNTYIRAEFDSITSVGSAGANQIWDFTSWDNQGLDTVAYAAPAGLPGASYFPTATVAATLSGGAIGTVYYKLNSNDLSVLGNYGFSSTVPSFWNPPYKALTFPSTYQTAFNGATTIDLYFPPSDTLLMDSVRYRIYTVYSSVIDAWGTLSTPTYSNVPALRQMKSDVEYDSVFVLYVDSVNWTLINTSIDTAYSYSWHSETHSYPLVEARIHQGDSLYSATYLTNILVGLNEFSKNTNTVSAYPSPTSDKLSFKGLDSDAYLIIFDVTGRFVEKALLKKNTTINVANYDNGIYFYNVVPLNGSSVSQGKFVVEK